LLGGGDPLRPGEVSLAHHGVLFLDELPEFRRHVIEGLRQPLEDGTVTICRARARARFPARPLLVAAVNPCPCGYAGDPRLRCRCSADRIRAYRQRLSGPLLDRLDLHLVLPAVPLDDLQAEATGEASVAVSKRVHEARLQQHERAGRQETSTPYNAALNQRDLDRVSRPDAKSQQLLRRAVDEHALTARGYTKLRRLARTIADLEGVDGVTSLHFEEAIRSRCLDVAAGEPLRRVS
jgi:magnesium chelatase family protein